MVIQNAARSGWLGRFSRFESSLISLTVFRAKLQCEPSATTSLPLVEFTQRLHPSVIFSEPPWPDRTS